MILASRSRALPCSGIRREMRRQNLNCNVSAQDARPSLDTPHPFRRRREVTESRKVQALCRKGAPSVRAIIGHDAVPSAQTIWEVKNISTCPNRPRSNVMVMTEAIL